MAQAIVNLDGHKRPRKQILFRRRACEFTTDEIARCLPASAQFSTCCIYEWLRISAFPPLLSAIWRFWKVHGEEHLWCLITGILAQASNLWKIYEMNKNPSRDPPWCIYPAPPSPRMRCGRPHLWSGVTFMCESGVAEPDDAARRAEWFRKSLS